MTSQGLDPQDRTASRPPVSDEVCRVLGGVLNDGIDVHRCLAAQASGRIGAPGAVEPLIAALLDEDEDVRTDAAEALSALADPQASQQLLENLLGDPCTGVKLAAIETLAKLQDRRVVPWLLRMVKGRDEDIVWDEEEFYSSGWDDWVDIQIKAVNALADLKVGEAVPDIVAAMGDENAQDMTEIAFKALARMGGPGIGALNAFLDEDSARLRRRAATALASTDDEEASAPLTRAFADPAAEVRGAALRTLAARAPDDDRLAALLDDPDDALRAEAVRLCGGRHAERLTVLIADDAACVQVAALNVLAALRDFSADEALTGALRAKLADTSAEIAAAAARALAATAPKAAVESLIPLLGDTGRPVDARLGALQGLTMAGGAEAVAALVDAIDDSERAIRLETMSSLARLANADAAWPNDAGAALLSALGGGYAPETSDEPEVQNAAAEKPREDEAVPEAKAEAEAEAEAVAEAEAEAFPTSTLNAILADEPEAGKILDLPEQGIELTPADMERLAMAKRIKGKRRISLAPKVVLHEDIRRFAARVLGDIAQAEVARALAAVLGSEDAELRLTAADSLARIGAHLSPLPHDVAETLLAAMATADRDMKLFLIRALAAADNSEAASALLIEHTCDEDSFVRAAAVRALSISGHAVSLAEALLDDPDPSVRLHAAQAVARGGGEGALELLADFAVSFEGYHGRQAARLMRGLDAARASALFIDVLSDPARKRTWSVAIEALEELNASAAGTSGHVRHG